MSFTFANLPGTQVITVDGGLAAVNTPTTQSILVLGTSAIGPANSPYQVVSLATAAQLFGLAGTLVRGMSECAAYCDNIFLVRIGTAQGSFVCGQDLGAAAAPLGTPLYAWSNFAGTQNVFVFPAPSPAVAGALLTTASFTTLDVTAAPILSAVESTDPVTGDDIVILTVASAFAGVAEAFPLDTGAASISQFLATVIVPEVAGQIINAGDNITIASATTTALDGTWTVLSSTYNAGFWTLTFNVTTQTAAYASQTAGTLTDNSVNLDADVAAGTGTVTVAATPGFTITLGEVAATAGNDYRVWYDNGVLTLWLNGAVVYSNDPAININTGDSEVSGTAIAGLPINNGAVPNVDTFSNALPLVVAAELVTTSPFQSPVFNAPQTGIGLTSRQLYIAQQNAMNILQGFPVDIVVTPGALSDNPNVAFYQSGNSATANNNPVTNPNSLDWLWTGVDVNGEPIYQWASEATFWQFDNTSTGAVSTKLQGTDVTATPTAVLFTNPITRLDSGVGSSFAIQPSGFHEVNFAYQLARFCAAQSEAPQADVGGCFGFIGCNGPASLSDFSLPAVRKWIGFLPVYSPTSTTGIPVSAGSGLLGIPFLVGAPASVLNVACADISTGRVPGLFTSDSGEYDGGPEIDANGYPVQCGAYLAVQGDYVLQSNGFGTYVGNIAGAVAGLVSSLDQQKAVTNKALAGVSQLYRASLQQLDSLTFADIDMLRFTGQGNLPVCLHDKTSATVVSDYTLTLRQRIKFLVIQTLLLEASNYIGNSTNDGLALTALKTALDSDCLNLQKRGYLQSYNFTITSTASQQKVGQASIQISFVPANELVQLDATIGINLGA
ncbi:MAG: hypothetical protein WA766_11670 [Candidatus Acidiferrales bacterium]